MLKAAEVSLRMQKALEPILRHQLAVEKAFEPARRRQRAVERVVAPWLMQIETTQRKLDAVIHRVSNVGNQRGTAFARVERLPRDRRPRLRQAVEPSGVASVSTPAVANPLTPSSLKADAVRTAAAAPYTLLLVVLCVLYLHDQRTYSDAMTAEILELIRTLFAAAVIDTFLRRHASG